MTETNTYDSANEGQKGKKRNQQEKYAQQMHKVRVKPVPTQPYYFYNSRGKNKRNATLDSIKEKTGSYGYNTSKYNKSSNSGDFGQNGYPDFDLKKSKNRSRSRKNIPG